MPRTLLHPNKVNRFIALIINEQLCCLPQQVSGFVTEIAYMGGVVVLLGYNGVNGNIGWHLTVSNNTIAEGCLRDRNSADDEALFMWIGRTVESTHILQSTDMRLRWIVICRVWWWRDMNCSTTFWMTATALWTSTHYGLQVLHSRKCTCKCQLSEWQQHNM